MIQVIHHLPMDPFKKVRTAKDTDALYLAIIHYFNDPVPEPSELDERGTFDILVITRNKNKAIETINNARSHPNWIPGARWGLVIKTMFDDLLEDGIMNEQEVYAVTFDENATATAVELRK